MPFPAHAKVRPGALDAWFGVTATPAVNATNKPAMGPFRITVLGDHESVAGSEGRSPRSDAMSAADTVAAELQAVASGARWPVAFEALPLPEHAAGRRSDLPRAHDAAQAVTLPAMQTVVMRVEEDASALAGVATGIADAMDAVLSHPRVHWVEAHSTSRVHNKYARWNTQGMDLDFLLSGTGNEYLAGGAREVATGSCPNACAVETTTRSSRVCGGSSLGVAPPGCHTAQCGFDTYNCYDLGEPDSPMVASLGLTGDGEVIAAADTGLDTSSCFFADEELLAGPGPTPVTTPDELASSGAASPHRNIGAYFALVDDRDDVDGHGTHVSGTISGSLAQSRLDAGTVDGDMFKPFSGLAPGSSLIFTDLGCSTPGGCICPGGPSSACPCTLYAGGRCPAGPGDIHTPSRLSNLLSPSYAAGARVFSNSFGPAQYHYSDQSSDVDAFVASNPDAVVVFSAGNDGDLGTVSALAQAKNVIGVGATPSGTDAFEHSLRHIVRWAEPDAAACKDADCSQSCATLAAATVALPDGTTAPVDLTACCRDACSERSSLYSTQDRAEFSSAGSSLDGRVKPDVLAPGNPVTSARGHTPGFGSPGCPAPADFCDPAGGDVIVAHASMRGSVPPATSDPTPWNVTVMGSVIKVTRTHRMPAGWAVHATSGAGPVTMALLASRSAVGPWTTVAGSTVLKPAVNPLSGGADVWLDSGVAAILKSDEYYAFVAAWRGETRITLEAVGPGAGGASPPGVSLTALGVPACLGAAASALGAVVPVRQSDHGDDPLYAVALADVASLVPSNSLDFGWHPLLHIAAVALRFSVEPDPQRHILTAKGGTSMATPVVAATAALIRQFFREGRYPLGSPSVARAWKPSAALVKAILINGARRVDELTEFQASNGLPFHLDQAYDGFGAISLFRSLPVPDLWPDPTPTLLVAGAPGSDAAGDDGGDASAGGSGDGSGDGDGSNALAIAEAAGGDAYVVHGGVYEECLAIGSRRPFHATLAWTDPQASPASARILVNDLDLDVRAQQDLAVQLGNNDFLSDVHVRDGLNNVEQVAMPFAPVIGADGSDALFRVRVIGAEVVVSDAGLAAAGLPGAQRFALAMTGDFAARPLSDCVPCTTEVHTASTGVFQFDVADADAGGDGQLCQWHIAAANAASIRILFPSFNVGRAARSGSASACDATASVVRIYAGTAPTGVPVAELCGEGESLRPVVVPASAAVITIDADRRGGSRARFQAAFSAEAASQDEILLVFVIVLASLVVLMACWMVCMQCGTGSTIVRVVRQGSSGSLQQVARKSTRHLQVTPVRPRVTHDGNGSQGVTSNGSAGSMSSHGSGRFAQAAYVDDGGRNGHGHGHGRTRGRH